MPREPPLAAVEGRHAGRTRGPTPEAERCAPPRTAPAAAADRTRGGHSSPAREETGKPSAEESEKATPRRRKVGQLVLGGGTCSSSTRWAELHSRRRLEGEGASGAAEGKLCAASSPPPSLGSSFHLHARPFVGGCGSAVVGREPGLRRRRRGRSSSLASSALCRALSAVAFHSVAFTLLSSSAGTGREEEGKGGGRGRGSAAAAEEVEPARGQRGRWLPPHHRH